MWRHTQPTMINSLSQKICEIAHLPAFRGFVTIHESIGSEHVNQGIEEDKTLVKESSVDTGGSLLKTT